MQVFGKGPCRHDGRRQLEDGIDARRHEGPDSAPFLSPARQSAPRAVAGASVCGTRAARLDGRRQQGAILDSRRQLENGIDRRRHGDPDFAPFLSPARQSAPWAVAGASACPRTVATPSVCRTGYHQIFIVVHVRFDFSDYIALEFSTSFTSAYASRSYLHDILCQFRASLVPAMCKLISDCRQTPCLSVQVLKRTLHG